VSPYSQERRQESQQASRLASQQESPQEFNLHWMTHAKITYQLIAMAILLIVLSLRPRFGAQVVKT
jgi:hypothetical protein